MSEDLEYQDLLDELSAIHESMPDLRFTRVIQESIDRDKRLHNVNLFDISSKRLLSAVRKYHAKEKEKRGID